MIVYENIDLAFKKLTSFLIVNGNLTLDKDDYLTLERPILFRIKEIHPSFNKLGVKFFNPSYDIKGIKRSFDYMNLGWTIKIMRKRYLKKIFFYDEKINQFNLIVERLNKNPSSRRTIINFWNPKKDFFDTKICLNYTSFRVINKIMEIKSHWRSRDLINQWGTNISEIINLGLSIKKELNYEIKKIRYFEFIDNLHIYLKDQDYIHNLLEKLKLKKEMKVFKRLCQKVKRKEKI